MACCFRRSPRHIQLVRALYPQDPLAEIPPNNLEQFLFFATTNQTHLEDSADYLALRLRRKLQKGRDRKVEITLRISICLVDRVDPPQLGSLLDSLMQMLQVLLESQEVRYQLDATQLFLHYAVREEPAPSHHRTYQFLMERFGSMALSGDEARVVSGLQALRGIIKKTSQTDLQPLLWQQLFLSHLLNAFLLNLSQSHSVLGAGLDSSGQGRTKERRLSLRRCSLNLSLLLTEPTENGYSTLTFSLAQTGLQELLDSAQQQSLELCTECFNEYIDGCGPSCQTDLESVAADLEPIFSFFVSSVKDPLRYLVIKTYLKTISPAKPVPIQLIQIRLLHTALNVSDAASLVPCVWEIQDSVISLLKHSVSRVSTLRQKRTAFSEDSNESILQSMIVGVLEKLCTCVADYQKKETIVYIVQKLPENSANEEFQLALTECLLKMSAVCRKIGRSNSLSSNLLETLVTQFPQPPAGVQTGLQKVFQIFLDPLQDCSDVRLDTNWNTLTELGLKASRASKQETQIYRRLKELLYWNLYELCRTTNRPLLVLPEVHRTLSVLGLSLGCEVVQEGVYHFLISVQDLAQEDTSLSTDTKIYLHCLVILTFHFFSRLSADPEYIEHVRELISSRWEEAPFLLPESNFGAEPSPNRPTLPDSLPESLLLSPVRIGISTEPLSKPRKLNRKITQNESVDISLQPYPAPLGLDLSSTRSEEAINFTDIREALDPSAQLSEYSSTLSDSSSGRKQVYQVKNSTYEELLQRSDSSETGGDYRSFVNNVLT